LAYLWTEGDLSTAIGVPTGRAFPNTAPGQSHHRGLYARVDCFRRRQRGPEDSLQIRRTACPRRISLAGGSRSNPRSQNWLVFHRTACDIYLRRARLVLPRSSFPGNSTPPQLDRNSPSAQSVNPISLITFAYGSFREITDRLASAHFWASAAGEQAPHERIPKTL
jgi:hypothetical protein